MQSNKQSCTVMHWMANRQTAKVICFYLSNCDVTVDESRDSRDMIICMILHIIDNHYNKTPTHCLHWHIKKTIESEPTFRSSTFNRHSQWVIVFCFSWCQSSPMKLSLKPPQEYKSFIYLEKSWEKAVKGADEEEASFFFICEIYGLFLLYVYSLFTLISHTIESEWLDTLDQVKI